MTRPTLFVTRRWPEAAERALADRFDVTVNRDDRALSEAELAEAMGRFDAVASTVSDGMQAAVFRDARARIVANYGVGYSHIDLDAARAAGVVVTNTPGVLTDCTADLAIGLMISAMRGIGRGDREVRAGRWGGWRPTHGIGAKVSGATLGVIGFGRIGQAAARRAAHGFGMRVLVWGRGPVAAEVAAAHGAEPAASLEALLAESDAISLHCPGGGANRHLIDAAALRRMKRSAVLVNTARGEVVDEAALAEALAEGRIGGAGLDVYEEEPRVHPRLLELENVVLAPHIGSATEATRVAMGLKALENLVAVFEGREPPDRVA